MKNTLLLPSFLLAVLVAPPMEAQTEPWWPHPIWGEGDQAGGSNWITPEKILEAVQLVKSGKVYELGHLYERGMPIFGDRTYALFIPGSPTGGPLGQNKIVYHDEFVCAEIGQVGTQFDGLGHVGTEVTADDGSVKNIFYNGGHRLAGEADRDSLRLYRRNS